MRIAPFLVLALACNSPRAVPSPPAQSVESPKTVVTVGTSVAPASTVFTPTTAIVSAVPCESDNDCAIDETRASCVAKNADKRGRWVCGPTDAYCGCDAASRSCTRRVPQKTSCKTDEECDIQTIGAFELPVKLPKPRAQKIKPCGPAHVPKCVDSACTVAMYKC
jgi:hypothetical protein